MSEQTKAPSDCLNQKYEFQNVILCHPHSILLSLKTKETGNKESEFCSDKSKEYVVKIISEEYYNSTLHQLLPTFSDSLYLLPCEIERKQNKVFFFYPKLTPVAEFLHSQSLTLMDIQNMVQDIGSAVSLLHQNEWIHGDIAPGNVYITPENHFILGDFSSSRPLSQRKKSKNKFTGATYTDTKIQSKPLLYQDIYSFSMMLYLFLHQGNHPSKESLSSHTPNNTEHFPNCTSFLLETLSMSKKFQKKCPDFSTYLTLLQSYIQMDAKTQKENKTVLRYDPLISGIFEEQTRPVTKNKIPLSSILKYGFLVAGIIFFLLSFSFSKMSLLQQNKAKEIQMITSNPTKKISYTHALPTNTPTPVTTPIHTTIPTSKPVFPTPSNRNSSITPKPALLYDISNSKYHNTEYLDQIPSPKQVIILFADHNSFTQTSCFYSLKSLQELYLNSNQIHHLSGISCMKSLRILDLSDNQITDISEIANLSQLQTLNLSYNHQISHIAAIKKMKHLQTLILTNTNISETQVKELKNTLPGLTIYY